MDMRTKHSIGIAMITLLAWCGMVGDALAKNADCTALSDKTSVQMASIPLKDVYKCLEEGNDPPLGLRSASGAGTLTTKDRIPRNLCGPSPYQACENALNEHSDSDNMPSGWTPSDNPDLIISETPWSEMGEVNLPCGAATNLSRMLIESMWGNVRFSLTTPPITDTQTLLNTALNLLLKQIGHSASCNDGKFWAIVNYAMTVILPQITGGQANFKHIYDQTNQVFFAMDGTYIQVPPYTTMDVDLQAGGAQFILPNGGIVISGNTHVADLGDETTVTMNPNGAVSTSTGQNYQVNPAHLVTLIPNGVIEIPAGTPIPILDPQVAIHPLRAVNSPPPWWDEKLHGPAR